jgi:hypothetical protein
VQTLLADGLQQFKGITDNVFTEISTSKDKNFSCVDLLDSPGMVDGEMEYPFDVTVGLCKCVCGTTQMFCYRI